MPSPTNGPTFTAIALLLDPAGTVLRAYAAHAADPDCAQEDALAPLLERLNRDHCFTVPLGQTEELPLGGFRVLLHTTTGPTAG
jgi:hypothetical protein